MNIVQINASFRIGSTGTIMSGLQDVISRSDNKGWMVCAYSHHSQRDDLFSTGKFSPSIEVRKNILISRLSGRMGYRNRHVTEKMVQWISEKQPNIIHLHNIHGDYLNLEVLFDYLETSKVPVVWTLHDCWAFTGRCSHFDAIGCEKWKTGCFDCKNKYVYPITYIFDRSKQMWQDKRRLFTSLENMVLVTPSAWLADYVRNSYLKNYPIRVIHNGIDLDVFKPVEKSKYCRSIEGKKVILGVANMWSQNKGLGDFIALNRKIDHSKYQIVLVGLNSRQLKNIDSDILALGRLNDSYEMARLYSAADIFVNPTYQDNFPSTNIEAIACGVPVVTYKTGGSVESVSEETGRIVERGDIAGLSAAIDYICDHKDKYKECRRIAEEKYNKYKVYANYLRLYSELAKPSKVHLV